MDFACFGFIQCWLYSLYHGVNQRLRQCVRPDSGSLAVGAALDLTRSKSELVLENALLRQQLIVLQRQVKRPALTWRDRALLVLMASRLPSWKSALMIVQPDTLLRWHREIFRRLWRRKSRRKGKKGRQPLAEDVVGLIKSARSSHWPTFSISTSAICIGQSSSTRPTSITLDHTRGSSSASPALSNLMSCKEPER
jgi:hypothetical protein